MRFLIHRIIVMMLVFTVVTTIFSATASAQALEETSATNEKTPREREQALLDLDAFIMDSSEEQGKVSLEESFGPEDATEIVQTQNGNAWQDTRVQAQLRSYYLDRERYDNSESTALALGGFVGLKTGYFWDRLALGATAYTSQPLYAPIGKGGTDLLAPVQQPYSVVGEVYGEYRLTDSIRIDVGRKGINTSYINESDVRMTPNTFQLAALIGQLDSADASTQWRFGAGYVDKIKERTSEKFVSMAEAAGVFGVDRGVYVGGVNYLKRFQRSEFTIGAVDFYSKDILNIFYTEAKYTRPLADHMIMQLAAQYSLQNSTGDDLQTGAPFSTNQLGIQAELAVGAALFSTSWMGNSSGADLQSPWGGIPSYNSVQVEDFNYAGVESILLRAAYTFKSVPGLSTYALWVNGSKPDNANLLAQDEYDFNLEWLADKGFFKGWSVRVRYAYVTQQEIGGSNFNDFRLIFNYDPPLL
ncbi:MAG: OprD family outer membrane porin [Arenimonas sp.]|nr:OprD family outer membrane porin [Arenimonas sp.]